VAAPAVRMETVGLAVREVLHLEDPAEIVDPAGLLRRGLLVPRLMALEGREEREKGKVGGREEIGREMTALGRQGTEVRNQGDMYVFIGRVCVTNRVFPKQAVLLGQMSVPHHLLMHPQLHLLLQMCQLS